MSSEPSNAINTFTPTMISIAFDDGLRVVFHCSFPPSCLSLVTKSHHHRLHIHYFKPSPFTTTPPPGPGYDVCTPGSSRPVNSTI